jgi:hypothetical protein
LKLDESLAEMPDAIFRLELIPSTATPLSKGTRMYAKAIAWALVVAVAPVSFAAQPANGKTPTPVAIGYGRLPLTFEANRGQTSPHVKFLSRGASYTAYLTADGIAVSLHRKNSSASDKAAQGVAPQSLRTVQFRLVGADRNSSVIGEDVQPGRVNYFFGQDPKMWRTNVSTFGRVRYKNIYPGIDLVYYGNHRQLECDFEVVPGADPRLIEFEVQGASQLELDAKHNLVVRVGKEVLTFESPSVYQVANSARVAVTGSYILKDSTHVAFRLDSYDSNRPLVIDPVLLYSTYLGGSGDDDAKGIAVDGAGNMYVAGITDSVDFPLGTIGSLLSGSPHVFLTKLDANGNFIYTDYLGGNSEDLGAGLTLDSANHVWLTGSTSSSDFPVVNAYQGTYPGGFNAFLTKISADGSSILYSTYLGGNGSDIPVGVGVDSTGSVTVGGYTSSTNFPVANAYQASASANQGGLYGDYGFVTKFSADGQSLAYSTYLGGSSNVADDCGGTPCWTEPDTNITGITVDASGNAYAAGFTNTYDFPVTPGAYLTTNTTADNSLVGFVTKINSGGSLGYSTYFYESSGLLTNITALAVDGSGSAYVGGQAFSDGTFPLTTTALCDPNTQGFACSFGFVTKFDPTGSSLSYSTFLGPNNFATPNSITLDASGNAYVLAVTANNSFNVVNSMEPYSNNNDLLLLELDAAGSSEPWSTYLGGGLDENGSAITSDSNGNLYLTGTTTSIDFPVTPGAAQAVSGGNADAFIMKIGPSSLPAATFAPASLQFGSEAMGSTTDPQSVLVRNMGSAALSVSSITVTGDFAQTNDCGASIPAAGSCSFSVTFTPTSLGQRSGTLSVADNGLSSPQAVQLAGTGLGVTASLTPGSLTFAAIAVGLTSNTQPVTVVNTGNMPLHISSIQVSGSFTQTNNCGASINPAGSCTVNVSFSPLAAGASSGMLTISDDAIGSTQTVSLNGSGSDFSVTGNPNSASVKSGSSVTYQLTIASVGGAFASAVKLSCTTSAKATCSVSPASVTPGQTQATAVLTFKAVPPTGSSELAQNSNGPTHLALWITCPGMFGIFFTGLGKRSRTARAIPMLVVLALLMILAGCAGGTGIVNQGGGGSGTPAGTYTVTVVGASGNLQHSLPLTVVVQ